MARVLRLILLTLTVSVFLLTLMLRVLQRQCYTSEDGREEMYQRTTSRHQTTIHSVTPLRLPYAKVIRPLNEILDSEWVTELREYLNGIETRHISLCLGDSRYMESVVNWLISALVVTQPPLENVLVVAIDTELYELLHHHTIDSVFIDPQTILQEGLDLPTNNSHVWITRMVLFRLLNYWGYTVATYDSDAIPVKNPQVLFAESNDSDLIGSEGVYPFDLHREWRSPTFCMGVALFRPSERTELFWNHLSEIQLLLESYDDQVVINNALKKCSILWQKPNLHSHVYGVCRGLGVRVALLPSTAVCRKCMRNGQYYVWHQKGARRQEDKERIAKEGGVWFLKFKQLELDQSQLKGVEWLRHLYAAG